MEHFVIIVNGWKPLTVIAKCSILDVAVVLDPPVHMDACLNTSVHVALIFYFSKSIKEHSDLNSSIKSLIAQWIHISLTYIRLNIWNAARWMNFLVLLIEEFWLECWNWLCRLTNFSNLHAQASHLGLSESRSFGVFSNVKRSKILQLRSMFMLWKI